MERGKYLGKKYLTYLFIFILLVFTFSLLYFLDRGFTGFAVFTPGPGVDQTTLTLQDADTDNLGDAYVNGGLANRNYGIDTDLKTERNSYQRTYIKFNLSAILSTQIIDESKLCLYLYNDQGTQTISVNHVYVFNWNEGTEDNLDVSGQDYTTNITWNNQPCGTNLDNSAACNLTAEDSLNNDGSLDGTWQCWNVTNTVSLEYESGDKNVSFILYTDDLGNSDLFYSKEYVGDTSLRPYMNITYHAANIAPIITLREPQNTLYTYNESLELNYSVYDEDVNLDSCWYNLDGATNILLVNCLNTTFDVSEGVHNITIYANDSLGLETSDFVNFNVDASGISLLISEPTGTKISRINIPLTYTVIGSDVSCWYNIKTSVGGEVITNTTLSNCSDSNFDVSTDGDYVLNLYVNNTLGTFDFEASSFSVDTSEGTIIINSGGGGGGGGSSIITGLIELEIEPLVNLIVYPEDDKKLFLEVKNTGTSILNDCNIIEKKDSVFQILSSETKNLASGEIYGFVFNLVISDFVEVGEYNLELSLECQEINKLVNLGIEIMERKLGFEILYVERLTDEQVKVNYLLEELSNMDQEVEIQFLLFDAENKKIAEIKEVKNVLANSKEEFEILIPIAPSLMGEMNLLVNLNSETYSTFIQEEIILGAPISGLAVFGDTGTADKALSIFLILLFLVVAFFIIKRILGHRRKLVKRKKRIK